MRRSAAVFISLTVFVTLLIGGATTARADEDLPENWNFLGSAVLGGLTLSFSAPGADDWNCRPTARHPRPVVLVHGTLGNGSTNWQGLAPFLANRGFCVFTPTYGQLSQVVPLNLFGGLGEIKRSARHLKRYVTKVRRATGARKVDIVGHSQGTLMPQYWVKYLGGRKHVRNYVSLAPLWKGTLATSLVDLAAPIFGTSAWLPVCRSCGQMATGSTFVKKLRKGGLKVKGVRYTNIMTRYDELVVPWTSGRVKGMRNIVLQDVCANDFAEHFEIAADPIAARIVHNAISPRRKVPVPCTFVLPFIGPVSKVS